LTLQDEETFFDPLDKVSRICQTLECNKPKDLFFGWSHVFLAKPIAPGIKSNFLCRIYIAQQQPQADGPDREEVRLIDFRDGESGKQLIKLYEPEFEKPHPYLTRSWREPTYCGIWLRGDSCLSPWFYPCGTRDPSWFASASQCSRCPGILERKGYHDVRQNGCKHPIPCRYGSGRL